jgi:hypothetical protein
MSQPDFRLPSLRFVSTDTVFPHGYHDLRRTTPGGEAA